MIHNQFLIFTFLEDNDSVSAKSAAQILPVNLAYILLLLNFLITVLRNSSASCSFTLIPDPDSYQKAHRPYLLMLFDVYHNYDF